MLFQRIGLSGEGTDAVVILEKTPFQEEKIPDLLKKPMNAELQMHNDIYCTFYLSPPPELSGECPQPCSGILGSQGFLGGQLGFQGELPAHSRGEDAVRWARVTAGPGSATLLVFQ